jgi:uncharacterized protein
MHTVATITGLCLALGGPAVIACSNRETCLQKQIWQQIGLVILYLSILALTIGWEQQPLTTIGLQPLRWQSILWGLAMAAGFRWLYTPIMLWLMTNLGSPGFDRGLATLKPLPIWYLGLAVVIGGVVEEGLYRGYATERLAMLTGSYWIGSGLALIAFWLAHVPLWGWIPAFTTVISGGLLTLLYLGTGDLLAAIVAHVVTDFLGIVIPALHQQQD